MNNLQIEKLTAAMTDFLVSEYEMDEALALDSVQQGLVTGTIAAAYTEEESECGEHLLTIEVAYKLDELTLLTTVTGAEQIETESLVFDTVEEMIYNMEVCGFDDYVRLDKIDTEEMFEREAMTV